MKEFPFLIYKTEQEDVSVNALIRDETIWLTQKAMAELFGVQKAAISKHLKNIFESGELKEEVVVSKMETTTPHGAIEGKTQNSPTNFYNLDAIIFVGYRVNSIRATHFRIWATNVLKEYMIKGFVMDDERLKQGKTAFGKDYFQELLERVRSIRASEGRIWQQVTDTMEEFAASINEFLTFRKYEILPDRGKISREMANDKAEQEYEVFNKTQVIESDFDREVKKILTGGKYYV